MFAMIPLGKRLRTAAQDLGLSDAEVARRAGLTERRYGHYVTGAREPDFATFSRICGVLGVTPNDLLGFSEAPRRGSTTDKLHGRLQSACSAITRADLEILVVEAEAIARLKRS